MLNPYAKENYRDILNAGFLDNKVLEILLTQKHPDPLIKRQSDQVICFMKLNHDQVPAMVRFYFSPPPPRLPILQRFKLTCKGIPFLQIVNDDCATCCTARVEKIPFLIFFFSSRIGTHVAVDHPHIPGFQRIGTTLHTDAKLTSQIPPRRPFV